MSLILTKFDNTLEQSDIMIPVSSSSKDEMGNKYIKNQYEIQQTSIYGIMSPLISVNNIIINFPDIINFELQCINQLPSVNMIVKDRYRLISTINTPGVDNELRIQIIPRFDNKYKKINLTFYITNISINNDYINIRGEYKLPCFTSSVLKSFGQIDTYTLFENIAKETHLGFATNIEQSEDDKRWIYCDNKSYFELLNNEIKYSCIDLRICDYWIDWWNNITLANIYERYNAIDKDEDMKVWVSNQNREVSEGIEIEPHETVATISNHPFNTCSELFIKNLIIKNKPGSIVFNGTDHLYSIYSDSNSDYHDILIQDGDVKSNIFTKLEYLGEIYGEYDYLCSQKKRDTFLQKINTNEIIEVVISSPLLGLMRGSRVNVIWYNNNPLLNNIKDSLDENGYKMEGSSNIPLTSGDDVVDKTPDGSFIIDESISGQYLIIGCKIKYSDKSWNYHLILGRPTSSKPKISDNNE